MGTVVAIITPDGRGGVYEQIILVHAEETLVQGIPRGTHVADTW